MSVVHLLGFGRTQILAQSAWFCSKVRGQPAGSASWWRARVGWAAHYGRSRKRRGEKKKKKSPPLQVRWSQKCVQIPTATFFKSNKYQGRAACERWNIKRQTAGTETPVCASSINTLLLTGDGRRRWRSSFRSISNSHISRRGSLTHGHI